MSFLIDMLVEDDAIALAALLFFGAHFFAGAFPGLDLQSLLSSFNIPTFSGGFGF